MYKRELGELVRFLETRPTLQDLAIHLGSNACLSGEVAKVFIGRIEADATITSIATFGYKPDELEVLENLDLQDRKPICTAIKMNAIVIRNNNEEYFAEYPDAVKFSDPWKSIVCIPLTARFVISLALQIPLEDNINHYEYHEMLGLLLRVFINVHAVESNRDFQLIHSSELKGKPLTTRQEAVFSLMLRGRVNREIAQEINYSESLVRQETVVIFAKLGVAGRKALLDTNSISSQV